MLKLTLIFTIAFGACAANQNRNSAILSNEKNSKIIMQCGAKVNDRVESALIYENENSEKKISREISVSIRVPYQNTETYKYPVVETKEGGARVFQTPKVDKKPQDLKLVVNPSEVKKNFNSSIYFIVPKTEYRSSAFEIKEDVSCVEVE